MAVGTLLMLASCALQTVIVAAEYGWLGCQSFALPQRSTGFSRLLFTTRQSLRVSLDMATPILQMYPLWSAALRCALPKREPSTGPCEKHTVLGSVQSR